MAGNYAVHLDGGADYINLGNLSFLDGKSSFSFEAWVYLDTNNFGSIIADYSAAGGYSWQFYWQSDRKLVAWVSGNGTSTSYHGWTSPAISLTTWTHIAFRVTDIATNSGQWYVNGSTVSTTYGAGGAAVTTIVPSSSGVQIGVRGDGSRDLYADGAIANIAFWNGAKWTGASFTVPTAYYNGNEDGLLSYIPLNEGSGSSFTDSALGIVGTGESYESGWWVEGPGLGPAPDIVAPTVDSVAVNAAGDELTITMSENIVGTPSGFSFTAGGASVGLSSGNVTNDTITYALDSTVGVGQTCLLSYTGTDITDVATNALVAFSDQAVTNNSTQDITAPTVSSLVVGVTGLELTVTYNENLSVSGAPTAFSMTADGASKSMGTAVVSANKITWTLPTPIGTGAVVLLSYTAGNVKDVAGNSAASFTNSVVVNSSGVVISEGSLLSPGRPGGRKRYRNHRGSIYGLRNKGHRKIR